MRKLQTIQTRGNLNNVYAVDEGRYGANHVYMVTDIDNTESVANIRFQTGPRNEFMSISGVLDTDLLEIVRDRLESFQGGEFACEYNAEALRCVKEALYQMKLRVEDRLERNVLGTMEK